MPEQPQTPPAPSAPAGAWTDERIEQIIGNLLRFGVLASALVVFAGGVVFLSRHGTEPVKERHTFVPDSPEFSRPELIVRSALRGSGRGLIQLGLLLLIATPVARVVFSAYAFARQRDRTYVAITLVVLAVLLYSLFSGHIH
jgi:uncharacterized membrane protein